MNLFDNASIKNILPKLNALYPEHKVFALSSLDDTLREKLNELYKSLEYLDLGAFLKDLGYEIIPSSAVKDLRSEVLYSPGFEPEPIKTKINNMLALLEQYYPSHIIDGGLQSDHKSLSGSISGLYQWLGYPDTPSFLEAYGYQYNPGSGGRRENDYQSLIEALLSKYAEGPKPKNMGILIFENPEYRGQLKTLQNKSSELFGMSLKAFFTEIGLLADKEDFPNSSSQKTSSGRGAMQDAAMAALKSLYDSLDSTVYGSFESIAHQLDGIVIKQNKSGKIYVFRADHCPESLSIPYGIDFISKGAFMGIKNLKKLCFPVSLTEISEAAFFGCSSLEDIQFNEGLIQIGDKAFSGCIALKKCTFPASLQIIGKEAFAGCISLENITNPNPLLRVEKDTFDRCPYQHKAFSDSEGTSADFFSWIPGKKGSAIITGYNGHESSIRIPAYLDGMLVTTLGTGAFQANTVLENVSMPDTISVLQKDVFRDCSKLKEVHLSNSISKITSTTFSGCISLNRINIPDRVVELKRGTFRDSPISDLFIGKSLQHITWDCFITFKTDPYTGVWKYLRTIKKLIIDPSNPYLSTNNGCIFSGDEKILFSALQSFRNFDIPQGVEVISCGAFEHMTELTDITFPDTLSIIGKDSFSDTRLRSIRIGRNTKQIEENAFNSCSDLSSVIFEDGIEEIGSGAFDGCPIVSVFLPSTVRKLGARSFSCFGSYNDKMLDFRISEDNPYLRADGTALYQLDETGKTLSVLYGRRYKELSDTNTHLKYVVEPGTIHIGVEAFKNCISLSEIVLPDGLISIGAHAFECTGLSELHLPASLMKIGEAAFAGGNDWFGNNYRLQSITVDDDNTSFFVKDDMLFLHLSDNTAALITYFGQAGKIVLPDTTVQIYNEAFSCSSVCEIHLPVSISDVGESAFKGCDNLRRIYLSVKDTAGNILHAAIYLPQVDNAGFFWDTSLRNQFMDCIRSSPSGSIFDFEKYDSLFPSISRDEDKILVAVDRLKTAVCLDPVYTESYRRFLISNPDLSVKVVITQDDTDGLAFLYNLGNIDHNKLDDYISLANRTGKTGAQIYLMNLKNDKYGFDDSEFEL